MLAPVGFDVVLSDASLTAVGPLADFAVVVVQQLSWPTKLSVSEAAVLTEYVEQGGKLVIVTKAGLPAEKLAKSFGFGLTKGGRAPLHASNQLVEHGSSRQIPTRSVRHHLRPADGQTVLVEDAGGNPVAASRAIGRGRVVVWADDHAYWDFCAQRDKITNLVASAPTTTAMFKWLLGCETGKRRGRVSRVVAENVQRSGSLEFRYSKPSADAAAEVMAKVPDVMEVVEKWNGGGPPPERPFTINWLSAGGGGWAGGHAAGVCVYGKDPAYPIKVMAHELTHSTTGPWPRAFNEAWASLVGMRAAEALGHPKSADDELARIIRRLDKVDPTRRDLDMMDSDNGPMNHDYKHKATWMLLELEKKYGDDFVARFLALRNQTHGVRKRADVQQTFELFARVSDDPRIWQWFQEIGCSARRPLP